MMHYFPDKFLKGVLIKSYFWQVFAVVRPSEYKTAVESAKSRLISFRKFIRNSIRMTDEALEVLNDFSEDDLNLLSNNN